MKKNTLNVLAKISLVIFSFLLLYYGFAGGTSAVWDGDSIAYHIPIAKLILSGKIFNPAGQTYSVEVDRGMVFSPGASEIILSLFILARIPLNLLDVAGILIFFFVMRKLAQTYGIPGSLSTIFAASMATLHSVMRWALSQTIDVWLASFFGLSLILLQTPKKTYKYFLFLGFALGMLFGSKYTGPAFAFFLLLFFGKKILKILNFKRFLAFLATFIPLGLFWYIRNYILTGDPYFPQSIPFFKGVPWHILDYPVWKIIFLTPNTIIVWLQAFISEYTVWCLALITVPVVYFMTKKHLNIVLRSQIFKLMLLALFCLVVYLFLPSGPYPNLITSGFRYTYPAFVCLILAVFLFAKIFAKEEILGIIAVTNMLIMPELSYHPKILIALIPVAIAIFYPSKIENFYKLCKKYYTRKRM